MPTKRMNLITALFLLTICSCAVSAEQVAIKPDPTNPNAADVYLTNPATGKTTRFLTTTNINRDHYHPAEYRRGHLYIIKRPCETGPDELWRYSADGRGENLWSVPGLDFRANNNGTMIAVTGSPAQTSDEKLYIITSSGKLIKSYSATDLRASRLSFGGWVADDLWIKDQETIHIHALIRVDTDTLQTRRYDLTSLGLLDSDYHFNPNSLKLAYSDYPVFFDVESRTEFTDNRTPVKLYVYDLETRKRKLITQSTARQFHPKWLDGSTLQYDNPNGQGKVTAEVK